MPASFNKVILCGRLTRDPQVKYIPSGSAVCDIGLAIERTWFDKASNQKKTETDFIDVTFWGRTAEVLGEYAKKGRELLVDARLQYDTWEDKQTQKKMSRIRVIGETMQLLGGNGSNSERAAPKQQTPQSFDDAPQGDDSDQVPF